MIEVKYFGAIAEKTNCSDEKIVAFDLSLRQLLDKLEQKYPLNELTFSVAVNQKIVQDIEKYELKDQDIVALLPPFAGG